MAFGSFLDLSGEDGVEFFLGDKTITVGVSSGDQFLEFFLANVF